MEWRKVDTRTRPIKGKVRKLVEYVRQRGAVAAVPAGLVNAVETAVEVGHIQRVIHGETYVLKLAARDSRSSGSGGPWR